MKCGVAPGNQPSAAPTCAPYSQLCAAPAFSLCRLQAAPNAVILLMGKCVSRLRNCVDAGEIGRYSAEIRKSTCLDNAVGRTRSDDRRPGNARGAAVISSPLWGVSDVALRTFQLRSGRVILSGVYDALEAMSPT